MKLNPLYDRVVLQLAEAESRTSSGIVIPDNAKEKSTTGTVLAVGPGRTTEDGVLLPMTVKVGDTVLFGKSTGQNIKVDGQDMTIVREDELFAVVE
jgi:chaperonin GroES